MLLHMNNNMTVYDYQYRPRDNSLLSLIIMSMNKYANQDELNTAQETDLYNQQPEIEEVSPYRTDKLRNDAKNFHQKIELFKRKAFFSEEYYLIVSVKWLKRWKYYVSYDQVVKEQPPQKYFGCGELPILNEDIVEENNPFSIKFEYQFKHLNVRLKAGLVENIDYVYVDKATWDILDDYGNIEIKRFVVDTNDGKKVELYYQKITVIPLTMENLKNIQHQKTTKLSQQTFQYSRYSKVGELNRRIEKYLAQSIKNNNYVYFPDQNYLRLWLMPEGTRKTILWNTLYHGCKANASFTYKLYLEGQLVEQQKIVNDLDIIEDTVIVAELRQNRQNWCFYNMKNKLKASCNKCRMECELSYVCSCKCAVYCSKQCKRDDKANHKYRCPNDAESDQEEKQLVLNPNSKKGLAGLRNLGNTCFMNSGLQCLSHIELLTKYFISNQYLKDINKTNKLGTQGELSTQYAKMVRNLWLGQESSFSPTHLKKSIAKFQPMFSGYNQHDSGELITYLLDGLHEDLNRVKQKPYTQTKDYDGRPDHVIAKQAWQTFLKRNQSVIVDLMYGQFKSKVQCPNESCGHVSITFDPFSACTVPILNNERKTLQLTYIRNNIYSKSIKFTFSLEKSPTLKDLLPEFKQFIGVKRDAKLIFFQVASYSYCDVIDTNQQADKIRRDTSYRSMFVRQLNPDEDPINSIKLVVTNTIKSSYYYSQDSRRSVVPLQFFYTSRQSTNKQVYHQLIRYYCKIIEMKEDISSEQFQKTYIGIEPQNQIFRILMVPTSRYYTCSYCQKKECKGCRLPYNDQLFRDHVGINLDSVYDRQKKIEIEIYWRKEGKDVQKVFQEIKEQQNHLDPLSKSSPKSSNPSIMECLTMFEKEETLEQDNAWYCPKCSDFVLARKQMKIYKAPKILILCLKRFKRKEYFSQKITIPIDFPVTGLDLTTFVSNPNLPEDYFTQKMQIEGGKVLYDLIGISNHFGSTGGGHYTAYCKDPQSGDWYDFDDSSVNKININDVVTQNAYILFYKRRE